MRVALEPVDPDALTADNMARISRNFEALRDLFLGADFVGTGSPNGVVTASPGATYINLAGGAGTTFYVKESGTNTNAGWVGK